MRRVLLLVGLTMLGALLLARAGLALAQGIQPGGPDASKDPFSYGCPEYAPYVATLPGDPGEGSLLCFRTQAEARHYSLTGEVERADPGTATSAATPSATSEATPTATSEASSSASNTSTSTATATATPTATQDPAANEREDEQASSEERKAKQDEDTRSKDSQDRTRSVEQTPLPETDKASNRYPVALAGITFVGLVVSGLLAARAILPWGR